MNAPTYIKPILWLGRAGDRLANGLAEALGASIGMMPAIWLIWLMLGRPTLDHIITTLTVCLEAVAQ